MKSSRLITRAALAGALSVSLLTLTVPQASAAERWTTVISAHGAKVPMCKHSAGSNWTLKLRLDDRAAKHTHQAHAFYSRSTGTRSVKVSAVKGKVSSVARLTSVPKTLPKGASVSAQIGHSWGGEAGGGFPLSFLRTCTTAPVAS